MQTPLPLLLLVAGIVMGVAQSACAAPRIPRHDSQVLEQLPLQFGGRLQRLRSISAARPGDLESALSFARVAIQQGRVSGEPRYFGQAEARLAAFADVDSADRYLLQGLILEQRHDFAAAIQAFEQVLRLRPADSQALLSRSSIHTVQGRYTEALSDCKGLSRQVSRLITTACSALPLSLNGNAVQARAALADALKRSSRVPTSERAYAESILADISERLGDTERAEQHYLRALSARDTPVTKAAYADLLLRMQRYKDVLALIGRDSAVDALLLRRGLAEYHDNQATAGETLNNLEQRFQAAWKRGDFSHQREAAVFALVIKEDPARALQLARENWQHQREPYDARLLVEAALANAEIAEAQRVLTDPQIIGMEDVELSALRMRMRSLR